MLATEATALCRGRAAAEAAAATALATFAGAAGENLPSHAVAAPVTILEALVGLGFAASKGEARRLVAGGGAAASMARPVADEALLVGRERGSRRARSATGCWSRRNKRGSGCPLPPIVASLL